MKTRMIICILMSLALLNTTSAADVEGGVNVEPVVEETIFNAIEHTEVTTDLGNWDLSLIHI